MTALNVIPPAHYVGAVESIGEVVELIAELQDEGGGLRRRRRRLPGPLLRPVHRSRLRIAVPPGPTPRRWRSSPSGAVTRIDRASRIPLDCLVWRLQRPDEPGWDSPVRAGPAGLAHRVHRDRAEPARDRLRRPGRRLRPRSSRTTRCVPRRLGWPPTSRSRSSTRTAGWSDSTARRCRSPRATWCWSPSCAAAGVDPMAIRLALLSQHYRDDWMWTDDILAAARRAAGHLARGRPARRRPERRRDDRGRPGGAGRRPGRSRCAGRGGRLGGRLGRHRQRRHRRPARRWPEAVDALLGVRL